MATDDTVHPTFPKPITSDSIYSNAGVLSEELERVRGSGNILDETNELMLLRAFANKLLKCLGGEIERKSFMSYLMKEKGMKYPQAEGIWNSIADSNFLKIMDGYVKYEFVDKSTAGQLVKVLSEIRGIIKQIEESKRKDSKHIKLEDMGELMVEVSQEVEKRLLKIGGKQDAVHEWRKWFSSMLEEFQARNTKGGK